MQSIRTVILVVSIALVSAAPAPAVTLMVNGDTPSVRWQRPFTDTRANVPTPDGRVDLYLTPCPVDFHGQWIGGCVRLGGGLPAPRIHVETETLESGAGQVVVTIAHELGHVFDHQLLTGGDRARFIRIWRRPADLGWEGQLAPPRPLVGSDGYRGIGSSAMEWFADVYQACVLHPRAVDRLEALDLIDVKAPARDVAWRYVPGAVRQISASCRLIEEAGWRAPLVAS